MQRPCSAGTRCRPDDIQKVAAQFARLTGLPVDYCLRQRLRVGPGEFRRKLLEAQNKVLGRYDARATADATSREDPSYANVYGAFATMLNAYVRGDLKFESDLPYEIISRDVHPWNYSSFENGYVNASSALASALTNNPSLRVFVACGYYDMATAQLGIRHTIAHLPMDPALAAQVSPSDSTRAAT